MHRAKLSTTRLLFFLALVIISSTARADWVQDGGVFNVDPTHNATNPDIAVSNNTPFVVWSEENASGKNQIYVKKNDGVSWVHASGSVVSLNVNTAESAYNPAIAAYNGTPYVVWAEDQGNTRQVYLKYLNGTSWEQLGGSLNVNPAKFADYPAIAMDGATPYVTWHEDAVTAYHILVKHWNGNAWEQDGGMLNLDGNVSAYYPDIISIASAPYVTWMEDFKIYVKKINGTTWEQVGGALNYNLNQSANGPHIAVYSSTPYVTWTEAYFGDYQIYVKHYNGSEWLQDGSILNIESDKDAYPTDIKVINNIQYVLFYEMKYVVGQIFNIRHLFMKHFDGSEWIQDGSSLNIDPNYDTRVFNSALEFVDNTAYVVWSEESATINKIYCKFYVLPTPTYTPTHTATLTITPTPTISPTPTITPTYSPTPTHSPTYTHSPTFTITPTITPTSTITPTATVSPTATQTRSLASVELGGKAALVYPNPARDQVNFLIHLTEPAQVEIVIYSITGDLVAKVNENLPAGRGQTMIWKTDSISPGIYLADIRLNGKSAGRQKLAIVK
ncbi:MAG: T9SS type A sorting domain-containing protein [candidate division FCPU426 bacterium]